MGSPRRPSYHDRSSYLEERESSTMSTTGKAKTNNLWEDETATTSSASVPKTTALHEEIRTSSSSAPFRRSSFLSRRLANNSNKHNQKQQSKRRTNSSDTTSLNSNEREAVLSDPATPSSVKSTVSSRRKSIQFLKRALSSPPILLQRLQSTGNNRNHNHNKTDEILSSSNNILLNNHNNDDVELDPMVDRISIVPNAFSPPSKARTKQRKDDDEEQEQQQQQLVQCMPSCNATSILLESIWGLPDPLLHDRSFVFEESNRELLGGIGDEADTSSFFHNSGIPEDPTVQESIECIFASQLEDGLKLWVDDEDEFGGRPLLQQSSSSASFNHEGVSELVSPTDLQQSRTSRKDRKNSRTSFMPHNKKRYEQASLVYVGTYDPSSPDSPIHTTTPSYAMYGPCPCTTSSLPAIEPEDWPQAPIALRPTPGSGTVVKAIRKSGSSDPLWVPGSHLSWSQQLAKDWGKPYLCAQFACCEKCVLLPVNNGNEAEGEALVVDFESDLFEGSLLVRLRYSNGTTRESYDDSMGYFAGVNRRYQVCVKGRFKTAIPFTELTTGFRFRRKFGKLPSKWVWKSALKVVSFFAPQLDIQLEGVDEPYSVTPLGSTPQCILVDDPCDDGCNHYSMQDRNEESSEARRSLLGLSAATKGDNVPTPLQRAKIRKKAFEKLYTQQSKEPRTDPSKIYTFEFLQHMLNFQDFSVELGSVLGSLELEDMLDGQPLQILAAHHTIPLWSFDVWNECLWEKAKEHESRQQQQQRNA